MFIDMKAQCFMEAAKQLNFTRAAEQLYISQPALSKNIAALEEECGMKLFYRDSKKNKVKLTPAGAVFLCEFQKMEKILDGVIEKAKKAESGQEGSLTIGLLFGQILSETTKKVLANIDENFPMIEIEKISGGFRDLRTWLDEGRADMVVTYEEEAGLMKNVLFEEVGETQLGFVVPAGHVLSQKRALKVKDLEGERIIIPDEKETFTIYETFRNLCHMEGFTPREITAPDLNHMNIMAEMGRGIAISREDSLLTKSPNLKFFKSEELGRLKLVAVWKKDNLNPIITFYHQMFEDIYQKIKTE